MMENTHPETPVKAPIPAEHLLPGKKMVLLNVTLLVICALFYLSGIFFTKALSLGIIFAMGTAIYSLLQIKYLKGRPKIAAKIWLMPMVLAVTSFPIPMISSQVNPALRSLADVGSVTAFIGCLVLFISLMRERRHESVSRKKRPLIINVRILVQTGIFILYLVFTAQSWILGGKSELFFWGAVNVISVSILPFIFGRAICGWICPNATLQDSVYKNLKFKRPISKFPKWIENQTRTTAMEPQSGNRKEAPYLPATLLLVWFPMFFLETVFDLTPVFWYPVAFMYGLFILSLLMPWRKMCSYFCWFSSYRCLASQNSLLRMKFNEQKCRKCKVCMAEKECPFYIDIKNLKDEMPATCCVCFACKEACVQPGVITYGIRNPLHQDHQVRKVEP